MTEERIAIIGAGLAGIAAAQTLRAEGCHTVVFEKSRSHGGRCATRNWEGDLVDHGAQYFTVGSSEFARAIRASAQSEVHPIESPLLNQNGRPFPEKKRYYHREGNNRLARALAAGLDIRFETPVPPPRRSPSGWEVCGEHFDRVLTTAPLPQSATLFDVPLDGAETYEPCLTLLARYWGEWLGLAPQRYGLAHTPGGALLWSACENHKAGRIQPGRTVFVLHASAAFSRQFWDADPNEWGALLRAELEPSWRISPAHFDSHFSHRWRFARLTRPPELPAFPEGVVYAGDAASDSRVESAWLAGVTAAERLLAELRPPRT
jgi:renalase